MGQHLFSDIFCQEIQSLAWKEGSCNHWEGSGSHKFVVMQMDARFCDALQQAICLAISYCGVETCCANIESKVNFEVLVDFESKAFIYLGILVVIENLCMKSKRLLTLFTFVGLRSFWKFFILAKILLSIWPKRGFISLIQAMIQLTIIISLWGMRKNVSDATRCSCCMFEMKFMGQEISLSFRPDVDQNESF